jgi:CxxC motif-containing protein (DUF1111 family)
MNRLKYYPAGRIAGHAFSGYRRLLSRGRLPTDFTSAEPGEDMPGGAATHRKMVNRDAFSHASANMGFERELDFKIGNGFFRRFWVTAPSSTQAADGLGPLFNARACQNCHVKDGRGHPPAGPGEAAVSMFLRLSIPPQTEADRRLLAEHRVSVIPEPTYGTQLQNFAVQGVKPEGQMRIEYEEVPVTLTDGTVVSLRKPTYSVADPAYGPLHPATMLSPRVAPPMIGLGLLEMLDEERHPCRRRPRRWRRRRHFGPAEPRLERGARGGDARPLRLEGRRRDRQ